MVVSFAPLRSLIHAALEEIGVTAHLAESAAAAIPHLTTDLAVVVLDFVTPHSGGHDVYTRLQSAAPTVPVVALRAPYRPLDRLAGAAHVTELTVPFTLESLQAAVRHAVAGTAHES